MWIEYKHMPGHWKFAIKNMNPLLVSKRGDKWNASVSFGEFHFKEFDGIDAAKVWAKETANRLLMEALQSLSVEES